MGNQLSVYCDEGKLKNNLNYIKIVIRVNNIQNFKIERLALMFAEPLSFDTKHIIAINDVYIKDRVPLEQMNNATVLHLKNIPIKKLHQIEVTFNNQSARLTSFVKNLLSNVFLIGYQYYPSCKCKTAKVYSLYPDKLAKEIETAMTNQNENSTE